IIDFTKSSIKLASDLDAQGDFSKISHSWTNEIRLMNDQWNTFMITMGQGFINILTPIITGLNYLIGKLQVAAQYFKAFTIALFGDHNSQQSTAGISNATASSDALGNSLDTTAEKAKKAKGALMGFDQINILKTNKDTGNNSVANPSGDMGAATTVPVKVTANIADITEPLKKIDFKPLLKSLDNLKTAMQPLTQTLFSGLEWAYKNIFVPLATWTIEKAIPKFLDALSSAISAFTPILTAFKPFGSWLWDNFLKPLAAWTGKEILKGLDNLKKDFDDIGKWIKDNKGAIETMAALVGSFAVAWGLVTLAVNLSDIAMGIGEGVVYAFGAAIDFLTDPITLVIAAVALLVFGIYELCTHWNTVKAVAIEVWDKIKAVFMGFVDWIKNVFSTDWSKSFGFLGEIMNGIIATVKDVWHSVTEIFKGVIDFVTGAFSGNWSKAWNGIKEIFGGIFDQLSSLAKGPLNIVIAIINDAIDGINSLIDKLDKVHIKLPDLLGGGELGFNIPDLGKLPYLATGGIIDQPTLAMVGERGKEAVMPLENNTGWINQLAGSLASKIGSNNNNTDNTEIVELLKTLVNIFKNQKSANISESTLANALAKILNNESRRQGKAIIL
ncbi:MAG: hypothetical protein Q8900_13510, partial [Bacillota bacterium]|nr:hypothetical protein [Bacillota bacterium]